MANDPTPFPTSNPRPADPLADAGAERVVRSEPSEGSAPPSDGPHGDDTFSRVVQGAHQTIDRLADSAAPHVQRLTEGLDARTGHIRELGDEWTESLRSTVRENPLAAVATALAVGLLVARLIR